MTRLLTASGAYDRRAIMTDAHKQFAAMRRHGWTWPQALSYAWTRAREQRRIASFPIAA